MFKNVSRKIAHTAFIASLSILSATAAQATSMNETSPETGHVSWAWWANTSAPHTGTSVASDLNGPEVGHLRWIWWNNEKQPVIVDTQGEPEVEMSPELGHVPWLWWN